MQNILYNLFHNSSMQAGLAGSNQTMRKNGTRHIFYIVWDGVVSARNGGISLGSTIESECAARTDTQFNGVMVAGSAYQFNDITFNARINTHASNEFLQALQALRA